MQKISLYRYIRPSGGVTVSPIKPDCEYTELYRFVADPGMVLVNGAMVTTCVDANELDGWVEVTGPMETEE